MSSSREIKKNIEPNEQDISQSRDLYLAENQQNRIPSDSTSCPSSFFSYIASFYTPTDSSDSSDALNEISHNKQSKKKQCCTENNVNAENRLLANETEDSLLADSRENKSSANGTAGEGFQEKTHRRKRKLDSANWVRNIRKAARIQGKPYISTTGVIQPGKILKEPCTCRKKCFEKFSEKDRRNIFMEFYKLSNQAQNQLIACSIEEYPKKTVRLRDRKAADVGDERATDTRDRNAADTYEKNAAATSRRSFSRKYFLNKPDLQRIEVCQTMFLNTLSITLMKVRVIVQKKRTSSTNNCYEDGRGKHGKQKPVETKQRIINHNS